MKTSKMLYFAMLTVVALLLASCATQPAAGGLDPPGFFRGCWHGFTIFFALAGHVFDHSIRIYAFPNSGGWYDFGFFLGAASFLGGGGSSASRRKGH